MATTKSKATKFLRCEWCKKVIEIGQFYALTKERDTYGSYQLHRHLDCQHTATLNEAANKAWW